MIVHSVVFKLKHDKGSAREKDFLNACAQLGDIPGVRNLRSYHQTSKKNTFDYGLFMEFETAEAYEAYNQHPDHLAFIRNYWTIGVADFMELDYEPMENHFA